MSHYINSHVSLGPPPSPPNCKFLRFFSVLMTEGIWIFYLCIYCPQWWLLWKHVYWCMSLWPHLFIAISPFFLPAGLLLSPTWCFLHFRRWVIVLIALPPLPKDTGGEFSGKTITDIQVSFLKGIMDLSYIKLSFFWLKLIFSHMRVIFLPFFGYTSNCNLFYTLSCNTSLFICLFLLLTKRDWELCLLVLQLFWQTLINFQNNFYSICYHKMLEIYF